MEGAPAFAGAPRPFVPAAGQKGAARNRTSTGADYDDANLRPTARIGQPRHANGAWLARPAPPWPEPDQKRVSAILRMRKSRNTATRAERRRVSG